MERRREKREEKGEDERGRREVSQEAEEKYGGDRERERETVHVPAGPRLTLPTAISG